MFKKFLSSPPCRNNNFSFTKQLYITIDIPCLVPESRDHDVLVLMSQDRLSWKQIRANFDNEMSSCSSSRRVTLDYLPAYIGLYTRHRMTSLNVDGGGGK